MGVAERREREREERRCQIIDAAERAFFRVGPLAATMEDVAREAELSKGTLYLYFRSKDDLYLAIAFRTLSALVARVEGVPDDGPTGLERMQRISTSMREYGIEHPQRMKSVVAWMASGFRADPENAAYDEYVSIVSRLFRQLVGTVESGKGDGSIRADVDALQFVMALWGGMTGIWMLYFARDEVQKRIPAEVDFEGLLPAFSQTLFRAIRTETES